MYAETNDPLIQPDVIPLHASAPDPVDSRGTGALRGVLAPSAARPAASTEAAKAARARLAATDGETFDDLAGVSFGDRREALAADEVAWLAAGLHTKRIGYLTPATDPDSEAGEVAVTREVVETEACDECSSHLKIASKEADVQADPVADDLDTLPLGVLADARGDPRVGPSLFIRPGA